MIHGLSSPDINQYIRKPNLTYHHPSMNFQPSDANDLRKRELKLRLLIRQMKFDQLHTSNVYQRLENELEHIKNRLAMAGEDKQK